MRCPAPVTPPKLDRRAKLLELAARQRLELHTAKRSSWTAVRMQSALSVPLKPPKLPRTFSPGEASTFCRLEQVQAPSVARVSILHLN